MPHEWTILIEITRLSIRGHLPSNVWNFYDDIEIQLSKSYLIT